MNRSLTKIGITALITVFGIAPAFSLTESEMRQIETTCRNNNISSVVQRTDEHIEKYDQYRDALEHVLVRINTAMKMVDTDPVELVQLMSMRSSLETNLAKHAYAIADGHSEIGKRLGRCAEAMKYGIELEQESTTSEYEL